MTTLRLALIASLFAATAVSVQAIERGAKMIDTLAFEYAELDDVDSAGGTLWGEIALSTPGEKWALLAGGGYGEISPDLADDITYWNVGLGLKYYLLPETSLAAIAHYEDYDQGSDRNAKGATAILKQRLIPVTEAVSPYVKGGLTIRERSTFSDEGSDDSFSEFLGTVGAGAELRMNNDLSFVFDGNYVIADASDDNAEDLDGWIFTFGMRYFWWDSDL